jgi:hypothetical protein
LDNEEFIPKNLAFPLGITGITLASYIFECLYCSRIGKKREPVMDQPEPVMNFRIDGGSQED